MDTSHWIPYIFTILRIIVEINYALLSYFECFIFYILSKLLLIIKTKSKFEIYNNWQNQRFEKINEREAAREIVIKICTRIDRKMVFPSSFHREKVRQS